MADKTDGTPIRPPEGEFKRKSFTYARLADKLAEIGVDEKEANIRNKLSRGKFSAAFMLSCLVTLPPETPPL